MLHLPEPGDQEDEGLGDGPPQHALVGGLAGLPEALLAILKTGESTRHSGSLYRAS